MNYYYDNIKILPCEISTDINNTIHNKLKDTIGDKCNKYGFIKKNTINITNKSLGKIISAHYDGSLYYKIEYTADVVNPKVNDIIDCIILKKNKHGILANYDCIYVVIPYLYNDHNYEKELQNLNINNKIKIQVIGINFEINDTQINVHGKVILD